MTDIEIRRKSPEELVAAILDLVSQKVLLRVTLRELRRQHEDCEDRYYACPVLWEPGEMGDQDYRRGTCECGADAVNARIDAALSATEH